MNYENIGKVVGKVINKNDRKKDKIISISDKTADLENPMNKIVLNKSFETIQQIPNKQQERQILYITGASGSGKSYYTQLYCSEYKKLYPKNEIYLFSSINEDSSIDKIKGLQRFILDDAFLKEEITAEDFKNSMVIFDDTDVISNKALKFKINSILNILLETGSSTP
jgi:chromosomal replication initiation ATPase DnaA